MFSISGPETGLSSQPTADICYVNSHPAVEHGQVLRHRGPLAREGRGAVQPRVDLHEAEEVFVGGEGRVGVAVDAYELRGDSLAHLGLVAGFSQYDQPRVGV